MEKGLGPCRITAGHGGGWDPVVVPAALGLVPRVCPAVLGWCLLALGGRAGQGCAIPVWGDESGQAAGGCASALQHLRWMEEQV